jgi:hypothetical protein
VKAHIAPKIIHIAQVEHIEPVRDGTGVPPSRNICKLHSLMEKCSDIIYFRLFNLISLCNDWRSYLLYLLRPHFQFTVPIKDCIFCICYHLESIVILLVSTLPHFHLTYTDCRSHLLYLRLSRLDRYIIVIYSLDLTSIETFPIFYKNYWPYGRWKQFEIN